jgi:hypothetical protein
MNQGRGEGGVQTTGASLDAQLTGMGRRRLRFRWRWQGSGLLAQTSGEGAEEGAPSVLLARKKGTRGENFGPTVTGAF